MYIDPKQLIQIAEIIDQGSFTKAAQKLNTSQPALSRVASMLEERLKAPLFTSRRNPVLPTALGQELADYGRTIRSCTVSISQMADRAASGDFGEITVGASPFYSGGIIGHVIANRISKYPEVRINLDVDLLVSMLNKLIDGTIDIIVGPVNVIEGSPDLIVEHVTTDHYVIVCRSEHPLLQEPEITVDMLSQARWISYARESSLYSATQQIFAEIGLKHIAHPVFETTSAGSVRSVIEHSDLLMVLPSLVATELARTGNFTVLPFSLPEPYSPIGYVIHKDRQTPALRGFIEAWREELTSRSDKAKQLRLMAQNDV